MYLCWLKSSPPPLRFMKRNRRQFIGYYFEPFAEVILFDNFLNIFRSIYAFGRCMFC